uniref:Apolipoprotein L n=1 Tax=Amphilophus citrinellus TaxID=61819 RepID=A0A3Q0SJN6_AMPCI
MKTSSRTREKFHVALCKYITETLGHIDTVKTFSETFPKWIKDRKTELGKLKKDIKLDILAEVLKETLGGLEKLDCFLDAVEKLAVTSLHVFTENQMLQLPKEIHLEHVQAVIAAARLICPLLLEFKRDAKVFFLPKLPNVEVLECQLERYIQTSQEIYAIFEKSCTSEFDLKMNKEVQVEFKTYLTESDTQSMLRHINQLQEIRMDPNFRMVFLFQKASCSHIICELRERKPRMLEFLKDLEQCAVQLDRMNKGAKISSVAGSSVGLVGGVLSIVGLALIPVTAGASLGLLIGGGALGVLSATNSAVTTFTEIGVNVTQQNKASDLFQEFMEDVQSIQAQVRKVISQPILGKRMFEFRDCLIGLKNIVSVGTKIFSLVRDASDVKLIKSRNLIAGSGKMAVKESQVFSKTSKMASEIPEMGQVTFKGSLALSKSARAGTIALNALFVGMDIFFICKDSISLAKGSETEVSQLIRARAALFKSEIDSWQKICDSLNEGLKTSENKKSAMERPFYPEMK